MKKILYLMAVDWYWIKQRPQFIAEMLNKEYDVTVVYLKEVFLSQALRNDKDELDKSYAIAAIPYRDKMIAAFWLQNYLIKQKIDSFDNYDYIWVGHPLLYRYIPKTYKGKIIYDCMDNHVALCSDKIITRMIRKVEKKLVQRADVVFATSTGLLDKINALGGSKKSYLVRNGYMSKDICKPHILPVKDKFRMGYFGTIADWMDFSLLLNGLKEIPELEIYLWGPVSNVSIPEHPRLILRGVVEHRQLWEETKDIDCLIMPFLVNDIIRDVDPVKLYEYISMGKNIVSVYYEEIARFRAFVKFYNSKQEFIDIIKGMISQKEIAYTSQQQTAFLLENSWESRYKYIISKI